MKNKLKVLSVLVAGVAATTLVCQQAQATPINGTISFGGAYTASGASYVSGDLTTAQQVAITSLGVVTSSGDLAGAGSATFVTPIGVNGNSPSVVGVQLWSVVVSGVEYVFNVTTETQTVDLSTQLSFTGFGNVSELIGGNLVDTTAGVWQLGFGTSGAFSWQANSGTGVPDGGTTVMLLGAALSGICLLRKKLA